MLAGLQRLGLGGLRLGSQLGGVAARGQRDNWRTFVQGEHTSCYTHEHGMQYVTDGKRKVAWFPGKDEELFFDLEEDPQEVHNLSNDPDRAIEVATWRGHLIAQLGDRPEGFTDGEKLIEQDGPTAPVLTRVIEDAQASEVIE